MRPRLIPAALLLLAATAALTACSPNVRNIPVVQDELVAEHDSNASLIADMRADGVPASEDVDLIAHFTATSSDNAAALATDLKKRALVDVSVTQRGKSWAVTATKQQVKAQRAAFDHETDDLIALAATEDVAFQNVDIQTPDS